MKYYLALDSALHSAPYSAPYFENTKKNTQETLYPSLIQKKLDLSIASVFRNIPFLSLFLIMREVCNISNKY